MEPEDPGEPKAGGARGRVFSFEEARQLLPAVRERTRLALSELAGLAVPEDDSPDVKRGRLQQAAAGVLGRWAEDILAMGIEVKGPWLVDFDSGAGYWCWRWPEESLDYFHSYEEGFGGRMRIQ